MDALNVDIINKVKPNMPDMTLLYDLSDFFKLIRNFCLLKIIFQLGITYKIQEIPTLICNHPLSSDKFGSEFTYNHFRNKVFRGKFCFFLLSTIKGPPKIFLF